MAETGDLWAGPPLVCPACRGNGDAHRLGSDLRCSNSTCGARSGVLEGTTIPVVASPPVIERVSASDVPGALPAHGGLASWLKDLRPDTSAFAPVGRAAIFLRAMRVGSEELFYADLCDALLPDLPRAANAIDLGCGAGNLTFEIARRTSATVVALDLDAHLLRWAERAAGRGEFEVPVRIDAGRFAAGTMSVRDGFEAGRIRLLCANLLDPPLEPATFDLVTLVNVLDEVPYPAVALQRAAALLRPGGHLLFASPDAWNGATTPVKRWLATTEPDWDRVFEREGFETLRRVDDVEWRLQDSPRLHHLYRVHGRLLRKR